ncbi:hypothetical protein [Afipia felis]|uniref:Uncharacterized protein n=2 Tax=Afipia felis TaxID=1035 RepID=A0A381AZB7_AFIFE|nr:hypothetical protein [Afipia felis]EKS26739.1 hypothetical protein HMPREF9697_03997 [Afipia felis ATCC 53690]SUU76180.1 Uncharacterised protein [Afipia felis]SUU84247.1 Uncharacterised protein [Afipia felis]SUW28257.1 Uncharacterised protein [Afipia felis]
MISAFVGDLVAKITLRMILWAVLVIAVVIAVLMIRSHWIGVGEERMAARIAAQDEGALQNVKQAKKVIDECYRAGSRWNATSGLCER